MRYLDYKGYTGTIEYSPDDNLLFGKILGIRSLISYEGKSGNDLEMDFKETIDEYLKDCESRNKTPEKAFKGSFNVRIPTDLHRKVTISALEENISLNRYVSDAIQKKVNEQSAKYD